MQEIIEEYMELANELKPHLPKAVDMIIECGAEARRLLEAAVDSSVDLRIRAIKRLMAADFTKEQAILLVIDSGHALSKALNKSSKKKS